MSSAINNLGLSVIWVNGMPRSGTSWLGQIFNSHPDVRFRLSPLFSYAFKDFVNEYSLRVEWVEFLRKVYYFRTDPFMEQLDRKKAGDYPVFEKKHEHPSFLVIKETRYHNLTTCILKLLPEIKFVFIIRNPCAAIYSWLNAPKEFPLKDDPMKYWRNGHNRKTGPEEFWGFDDWIKLTKLYTSLQKAYPKHIFIQRYEDLVKDPFAATKAMFRFTGLGKVPNQTNEFLCRSQKIHLGNEYAVFKAKEEMLGKWKGKLHKEIQREIEESLRGTEMSRYLEE